MLNRQKIVIGPPFYGIHDRGPINLLKNANCELIINPFGRKLKEQEVLDLLKGADGIIAGLEPLTRNVLAMSKIKVISRCGSGMSSVDLTAARDLGIKVCSTPLAPIQAVAEITVGMMITLLRNVAVMDRDVHAGVWRERLGSQLSGKTIVVVGLGRIGIKVIELLRPFEVTVIGVDPVMPRISGVQLMSLDSALQQADIVTLHASGDTEIMGEKEFTQIKRGAILLNAGRGGLVNERVLTEALENETISSAWIDTYADEPYYGQLTKFSQVVLTPHIGSGTREGVLRMEMEAAQNLLTTLGETT